MASASSGGTSPVRMPCHFTSRSSGQPASRSVRCQRLAELGPVRVAHRDAPEQRQPALVEPPALVEVQDIHPRASSAFGTLSARTWHRHVTPSLVGFRPWKNPGRKPTVKQVYAVAFELCERAGEQFPETVAEASAFIERLRIENGKPVEPREPRPQIRS